MIEARDATHDHIDLWRLDAKWIWFGIVKGDGTRGADESVKIEWLARRAKLHAHLALRMRR